MELFKPRKVPVVSGKGVLFIPAIFFVGVGIFALVWPKFFVAALASIFVFLGLSLAFAAWKIKRLFDKVESVSKKLNGRFVILNQNIDGMDDEDIDTTSIIFH